MERWQQSFTCLFVGGKRLLVAVNMKYVGLVILILAGLFSFFAKQIIVRIKNIEEPSVKEVAVTKIVAFLIAAIGALIVFHY